MLSQNYIQSNWTKLEFQAAKNLTMKDKIEVNSEDNLSLIISSIFHYRGWS